MRDRRAVDVTCGVRSPGRLSRGCERCSDGSADKCASIHGRILLLPVGKGTEIRRKKEGRSNRVGPPFWPESGLEVKPQTELHAAREVSAGRVQEVRAVKISARIRCVHSNICT